MNVKPEPERLGSPLLTRVLRDVGRVASEMGIERSIEVRGRHQPLTQAINEAVECVLETLLSGLRNASSVTSLAVELAYGEEVFSIRMSHDARLSGADLSHVEDTFAAAFEGASVCSGKLEIRTSSLNGVRVTLEVPYIPSDLSSSARTDGRTGPPNGQSNIRLIEELTPQEERCLILLAAGLSNKEIAARLHLGVGTVKYHLAQIYQKLGVNGQGRGAAVAKARSMNLLFD